MQPLRTLPAASLVAVVATLMAAALVVVVPAVQQVSAFRCNSNADCCTGAACIFPRTVPPATVRECVLPNDALCQPCQFGFHYRNGVCVPDSDPCSASRPPCKHNETCIYEPKMCIRAPCPQYRCELKCRIGETLQDGVCVPLPNPCLRSRCNTSEICVFEPKVCIRAPCPQYRCVPKCKLGFHEEAGRCVADADPCSPNPCKVGEVCQYDPKQCLVPPCPQYTCTKPCVFCPQVLPVCDCPDNYCCRIRPQTCDQCAAAECYPQPISECVFCPQVLPECEHGDGKPGCADGFQCVVFPQTCKRCAVARCLPSVETYADLSAAELELSAP